MKPGHQAQLDREFIDALRETLLDLEPLYNQRSGETVASRFREAFGNFGELPATARRPTAPRRDR